MNEPIQDAGQAEAPTPVEPQPSPGTMLSRRRSERGMSLDDVAQRLKYGTRQIQALEEDDYPRLPGPTFVRGMIRSYAKLLELDPAPLLGELQRREIPAQVTVDLRAKRIPFPDGSKRSTRVYVAMSALVVLVAAAVIFEWQVGFPPLGLSPGPTGGADAQAPAPAPAPASAPEANPVAVARSEAAADQPARQELPGVPAAAPAVPAAAAAPVAASAPATPPAVRGPAPDAASGRARIVLQFQRESWVEIKQADGRIIMSQMNRGGTEQELGGTPPFDVIIGNAPSVRLVYNGQPVDLRPHFKVDVARLILE